MKFTVLPNSTNSSPLVLSPNKSHKIKLQVSIQYLHFIPNNHNSKHPNAPTMNVSQSNLTHAFAKGQGYGNQTLLQKPYLCTLETCDLSLATFNYIPTLPGNAIYVVIFFAFLIGQLGLGIKFKTWGYMTAMVLGLLLEVVGYGGRIMIHNNPFNGDAFLISLVTLTIAPAFLTASIYLCLGRIINVYGENLSYFQSRTYTIVFCTFDFICLILQAAGGAIASMAKTQKSSDLGKNIMLAGLIFQVIALIAFTIACAEFGWRVIGNKGRWNPKYRSIVRSVLFKSFLVGLFTATITILIRSIFRCVELFGGFNSDLFKGHEGIFMFFEGAMIVIATGCLTLLHPGICFQGAFHDASFHFRSKKGVHSKLDGMHSDESQVRMINNHELSNSNTAYAQGGV